MKDIVGVVVFLAVFSIIMFFMPDMGGYFLEANNFIPADPLKTPEHIAPVWYFTPYYAMLRAVPSFLDSQFWGVLVMGAAVLIFFALPWLDRGAVKSIRYRGTLYKVWLALFVVSFLILGYLGVVPVTVWGQFPESWPLLGTADRATVVVAGADRRVLPVLPADAVVHRARQDQARAGKGDRMMNKLAALLGALLLAAACAAGPAAASGGATCASSRRRSTGSTSSRCSAARGRSSTTASTATARSTCATTG